MKILVVGSGGREHALCRKIAESPLCTALLCTPGNAGIATIASLRSVAADDVAGLVRLAQDEAVDLVVVGPEVPLVAGLVDRLEAAGIKAFGPNAAAAQLEGSKGFMKDVCARHNIPTAAYGRFTDAEQAKRFVTTHGKPMVVKADGLAAGKGVFLPEDVPATLAAIDIVMKDRAFGAAGDGIVIEEFLAGEEASFFALVDGEHALPLGAAQDHKRAFDGDLGPNTGGMGAYSPAPVFTASVEAKVMEKIIGPTVKGMAAEGIPFKGILFAGLMIDRGEPRLLEYNVRFGDPECQVLMARLQSDLVELMLAAVEGTLAGRSIAWKPDPALVVVMAARGYPDSYAKGTRIDGLEEAGRVPGVSILHAGTALDSEKHVVANGGRVLGVTATGSDLAKARTSAYQAVDLIRWPEGFCRRDIGWRALRP